MSGFEVVGVVLALFPIVVDVVRTYRVVDSGQPLEHLIKEICTEEMIFRGWVAQLLIKTGCDALVKEMMDPKSAKHRKWQDPSLRAAVQQVLGFATADFLLSTFSDIHIEMKAIEEALKSVLKREGVSPSGTDTKTLSL